MSLAALLLMAGAPAAAAPAERVTLGDIRVQLYYALSGTLSGNVAPPSRTVLWNTIIGEGDAKEPASDVLIAIGVKGGEPDTVTDRPLVVTARAGGKLLAQRSFTNILVPIDGQAWSALWLPDATCKGKVTIEAVYGDQRRSTMVDMACGE